MQLYCALYKVVGNCYLGVYTAGCYLRNGSLNGRVFIQIQPLIMLISLDNDDCQGHLYPIWMGKIPFGISKDTNAPAK